MQIAVFGERQQLAESPGLPLLRAAVSQVEDGLLKEGEAAQDQSQEAANEFAHYFIGDFNARFAKPAQARRRRAPLLAR